MTVMPNFTWPDTVYYQSFISPYMGGKINIVDDLTRVRFSSYGNGVGTFAPCLAMVAVLASMLSTLRH